ncbi:helix-turn-helix domain-containing protein [Methylobacterium gregans]|uniref:Helix-turn-helix domain-containing protein n=1 Tax=Methylobacterium gregans TaxID=374424 RepID=A0AA37HLJ7_9HYPH|nr:helix-turn-helix domain-containing protein [Methylobacterium gregans]MDQ0523905.1 excisionase family DNA binding protein [Methylobacterium gregans]GJD77383.1 hypothetical protein NBEOAGPD_0587 [Methylobacterium gregans]GLS56128.1 hypothetical protein GCM10007886_43130 [Methylobacterium gregans]
MLRIHDHEDGPAEAGEIALLLQGALTLQEVAERLGISLRHVQGHVDDGSLVAIDVGRGGDRRSLRVLTDDLEGFVKRRRTAVAKAAPFPNALAGRPKPLPANPDYAQRRAARLARRKP